VGVTIELAVCNAAEEMVFELIEESLEGWLKH
jgi:hypothetical protein